MAQKGISRETIIEKAMDIVSQSQEPELSMRELARQLNIKAPSLYNHIGSMDELLRCVSVCAAQRMRDELLSAMGDRQGDEAVYALANAYRTFARRYKGLYKMIMASSKIMDENGHPAAEAMVTPVIEAISHYSLTQEQVMHGQRVLRSIMHGFVSQEETGFFRYYPADVEVSYSRAICAFLCGLKFEGDKNDRDCHE